MNTSTPTDDLIAQGAQQRGTEETAVEVSEARTSAQDPDLDPAELEAKMTAIVETAIDSMYGEGEPDHEPLAKDIVRKLLLLQGTKGRKLVFTRFDIMQIFAIWTRKLEGKDRV